MELAVPKTPNDCDGDVRKEHYVYIHKDKATGVPFYVGKGVGRRAHSRKGRNHLWHEKDESLANDYAVEIVEQGLTEDDACDLEMHLI